jgi:hypothetical protein
LELTNAGLITIMVNLWKKNADTFLEDAIETARQLRCFQSGYSTNAKKRGASFSS